MLPHDFVGDSALTGNHQGIIKRMNKRQPTFLCQSIAMKLRLGIVIADKHNLRIQRLDRFDFDIGRGFGHHNDGAYSEMLRRKSNTLRVIARACRNHAGCALGL